MKSVCTAHQWPLPKEDAAVSACQYQKIHYPMLVNTAQCCYFCAQKQDDVLCMGHSCTPKLPFCPGFLE